MELLGGRASSRGNEDGAVVVVVSGGTVDVFGQAETVLIVSVSYVVGAIIGGDELFPLPTHGIAKVGSGVAHFVVRDGLAVVGGELIPPAFVAVGIGVGGGGATKITSGVGVGLFVENIPPAVVLVGDGLVGEAVVLTDELVGSIVGIGDYRAALRDLGDIAVGIVPVGVGCVTAVLPAGYQSGLGAVSVGKIGDGGVVVTAEAPSLPGQSAKAVISVGQGLAAGKGSDGGAVVLVVGIGNRPGSCPGGAGEFGEVVVGVVLVFGQGDATHLYGFASVPAVISEAVGGRGSADLGELAILVIPILDGARACASEGGKAKHTFRIPVGIGRCIPLGIGENYKDIDKYV